VQKGKAKIKAQQNTYKGIMVDTSDISEELTDRAKRFVFWFCFPGSDTFQNKKRAAIAAGYASRNASVSGYKLCKNPQVTKEIERISKSYNSETIDTLYRKYINTLETRAFFDPAEYITGTAFKQIENIPLEKRICLEQPVINKKGEVVGYAFGSRKAAMTEIKELYEKERHNRDNDEHEETIEVIMERVTLRQKQREAPGYRDLENDIVEYSPDCQEEL
jgi:hypothetical protein